MHRSLIRLLAITTITACTAACAPIMRDAGTSPATSGPLPSIIAMGQILTRDGNPLGQATIYAGSEGPMQLRLEMTGVPAGVYGMHIHAVGRCDAPAFTSAGPHWNPDMRQHGRLNPSGTHRGDLPNLEVGAGGIVAQTHVIHGLVIGEGGLIDADGAAFVLHARADDERSDPSGNSGDRIACAVLAPFGG